MDFEWTLVFDVVSGVGGSTIYTHVVYVDVVLYLYKPLYIDFGLELQFYQQIFFSMSGEHRKSDQ